MAAHTPAGKMAAGLVAMVLLLLMATQTVFSGEIVEYLPGFDGKLPFKLETGYISVGDSELFYYFIESEGNPSKDPLFLWIPGGPGCSSLSDLVYAIGPLEFNITNYEGGLPTFNYYPYAWTKTASIIFLDSPIGTGFSYSTTSEGWASSDSKASKAVYKFLLKWLEENPKYLPLETYIGGDSYSGIIVPLVTKLVVEGLEAQVQPRINLKGYLVGSPSTDSFIDTNSRVTFAYRMGLISDEVFETAKESCNENYVDVDPSNTECVLALEQYEKCVKDLYSNCILEPKCTFARSGGTWNRRSLESTSKRFVLSPPEIQDLWCRNFNYTLSMDWANDPRVKETLHVREGTVYNWVRCNTSLDYTEDVHSVVDVHIYLSSKQLNVLVDCGDRDMTVPFVGTMQWIKYLNLTVGEQWRPWFVDGQVAGYTEKYYASGNGYKLVFATVKVHNDFTLVKPPCCFSSIKEKEFEAIKERIAKKVQGWKTLMLSQARRKFMLKSIVQNIPTYVMSVFRLPCNLINEIH